MTTTQTFKQQIIIDNITINNNNEIDKTLKHIFKNKIENVTILKRGCLLVTPSHADHIKDITDYTQYPTETFGQHIYIHTTNNNKDKQPWLCINMVAYDAEHKEQILDIIRETLSKLRDDVGNSVKIVGLHRKYKGKLPTSLILLKTETAAAQQYLLNNDLEINQHIHTED